jgi:hypothetical protein
MTIPIASTILVFLRIDLLLCTAIWSPLLSLCSHRESPRGTADVALQHQDVRPRFPAAPAPILDFACACISLDQHRVAVLAYRVLHCWGHPQLDFLGDGAEVFDEEARGSWETLCRVTRVCSACCFVSFLLMFCPSLGLLLRSQVCRRLVKVGDSAVQALVWNSGFSFSHFVRDRMDGLYTPS